MKPLRASDLHGLPTTRPKRPWVVLCRKSHPDGTRSDVVFSSFVDRAEADAVATKLMSYGCAAFVEAGSGRDVPGTTRGKR